MKTSRGVFSYWIDLVRFTLLGHMPRKPSEIPVWALSVPYRQWHHPSRMDGTDFEEAYFAQLPPFVRMKLPLRRLYLLYLLAWPFIAAARALRPGRGWTYWRGALWMPELALLHPRASFTPREWAWSRPDFSLSMLYSWELHHLRSGYLQLEDKLFFKKVAETAALPVPRTFSVAEAMREGGTFIVKDPDQDTGHGIALVSAEALAKLPHAEELIIQARLWNHPALKAVFSPDAPLSSLRVLTTLDPETWTPVLSRLVIRIGRAGSVADNTGQGGIWATVDPETGQIRPGVTKESFGQVVAGVPARVDRHPDTGICFSGLIPPFWEEAVEMSLEAHRRLAPSAATFGWDIGLSEDGPVFLEVNVWTVAYDYDPATDLQTPAFQVILHKLEEGQARLMQQATRTKSVIRQQN